ncbi:MAG: hypothetical protein LBU48_03245 [Coriobacteriales bacterium]|jgi:hypothetical protein|nr:hypothetical protein [Coriobacteriales bacterium]
MIPVNLTLSPSSTSTAATRDFIEVPEGSSAVSYLMFEDSSTINAFELRRRVRKRHKSSDSFDAWGEWAVWTETLPVKAKGLRLSQTPLTVTSTDVNPNSYDLAEWEFQVREVLPEPTDPDAEELPEGWSASLFAKAYFAPAITLGCTFADVSTLSLNLTSSWLRNDNTIVIEDVLMGQAAGPSALPSIMAEKKPIVLSRIVANGSGTLSVYNFTRHPVASSYLTFVYRFSTCDHELSALRYAPVLVTYSTANTPQLTLTPRSEEGYVDILMTDKGDKGKTITSASVLMLNGMGVCDLIPVKIGVPARHYVPPLDVPITYQAIAMAADGSKSLLTQTITVPSAGRLWFNWGIDMASRLALDANIGWRSGFERDKTYVEVAEGLPKVFFGGGRKHRLSVSGDVIYPRNRTELETLAYAASSVFREPYGMRRLVAPDSVDIDDAAGNIQTVISISCTGVAS